MDQWEHMTHDTTVLRWRMSCTNVILMLRVLSQSPYARRLLANDLPG
jgi:hypothetical protein